MKYTLYAVGRPYKIITIPKVYKHACITAKRDDISKHEYLVMVAEDINHLSYYASESEAYTASQKEAKYKEIRNREYINTYTDVMTHCPPVYKVELKKQATGQLQVVKIVSAHVPGYDKAELDLDCSSFSKRIVICDQNNFRGDFSIFAKHQQSLMTLVLCLAGPFANKAPVNDFQNKLGKDQIKQICDELTNLSFSS